MFSKFKNVYMLYSVAPNSAKFRGGCRGPAKIRQGGVAIIFYFLRIKKYPFLEFLRYEKVPFSEFLCKAIKKDSHLTIFTI